MYSIDSTCEPKTGPHLGRLVNHGEEDEINAKMCKMALENKPVLTLFAITDIRKGEEIRYDYGVNNLPWKKTQVGPSYELLIS